MGNEPPTSSQGSSSSVESSLSLLDVSRSRSRSRPRPLDKKKDHSSSMSDKNKVLYSIVFKSGAIIQYSEGADKVPYLDVSLSNIPSKKQGIAIELILHCTHGDIGPIPISQLQSEEERSIDLWSSDYGKPKYCIVIMYREQEKYFPQWSIQSCTVKIIRQHDLYESVFKHEMPLSGGSANVYSLTMSPSKTRNQTVACSGSYSDCLSKKD